MLSTEDKEFITMSLEPLKRDIESCNNQLIRINGRVGKHDDQIQEALIERSKNREHQADVEKNLNSLCDKVNATEKELLEYRFVRTYPRVFIIGAGIFFVSAIVLFLSKIGIF